MSANAWARSRSSCVRIRDAAQNTFSPPSPRSCQRIGVARTVSNPAVAIALAKSGHRAAALPFPAPEIARAALDHLHARPRQHLGLVELELDGAVGRRRQQLEAPVHPDQHACGVGAEQPEAVGEQHVDRARAVHPLDHRRVGSRERSSTGGRSHDVMSPSTSKFEKLILRATTRSATSLMSVASA